MRGIESRVGWKLLAEPLVVPENTWSFDCVSAPRSRNTHFAEDDNFGSGSMMTISEEGQFGFGE
jgi:hypothetical protein